MPGIWCVLHTRSLSLCQSSKLNGLSDLGLFPKTVSSHRTLHRRPSAEVFSDDAQLPSMFWGVDVAR